MSHHLGEIGEEELDQIPGVEALVKLTQQGFC